MSSPQSECDGFQMWGFWTVEAWAASLSSTHTRCCSDSVYTGLCVVMFYGCCVLSGQCCSSDVVLELQTFRLQLQSTDRTSVSLCLSLFKSVCGFLNMLIKNQSFCFVWPTTLKKPTDTSLLLFWTKEISKSSHFKPVTTERFVFFS